MPREDRPVIRDSNQTLWTLAADPENLLDSEDLTDTSLRLRLSAGELRNMRDMRDREPPSARRPLPYQRQTPPWSGAVSRAPSRTQHDIPQITPQITPQVPAPMSTPVPPVPPVRRPLGVIQQVEINILRSELEQEERAHRQTRKELNACTRVLKSWCVLEMERNATPRRQERQEARHHSTENSS